MKKDVLLVTDGLGYGGVEKSIINLLSVFNYEKYNVDLYLLTQSHEQIDKINRKVNILPSSNIFDFFHKPIKIAIKKLIKLKRFDLLFLKLLWTFETCVYKLLHKPTEHCGYMGWMTNKTLLNKNNKNYDIAIGYIEKSSIYYIVDMIKADRKIGWIHTDYSKIKFNKKLDRNKYSKLDNIVTVSKNSANVLSRIFPELSGKITIIPNYINEKQIVEHSKEGIIETIPENAFIIVSVGRLTELKGFDIAIKCCKLLLDKGFSICWYVIGDGSYRNRLEELIEEYDVLQYFHLLGARDNPYPYILVADICVQLSEYEGLAVVVEEEKILNKPIVVSDIPSFKEQIENNRNGLVVKRDEKSFADAIAYLIENESIRKSFSRELQKEKLKNENILNTIYGLIDDIKT